MMILIDLLPFRLGDFDLAQVAAGRISLFDQVEVFSALNL